MKFQPSKPVPTTESIQNDIWNAGKGWRTTACTLLVVNLVLVAGWLMMFGSDGYWEDATNGLEVIFGIIKFGFGLGAILFGSVIFIILGLVGTIAGIVATVRSNNGKPLYCASAVLVAHIIMTAVPMITIMTG